MLSRDNREKKLMGGSENEGKLVWSGVVEEWRPKQNHFSFLRSGHVRSEVFPSCFSLGLCNITPHFSLSARWLPPLHHHHIPKQNK